MNKVFVFISIITLSTILFLYIVTMKSTDTMTYFPPDQHSSFIVNKNSLSLLNDELVWEIESKTNENNYLRQDVALIYENGQFKGVINLWKQNENLLQKQKWIPHNGNKFYDTISFHHGEIHHDNDRITSIQKMTKNSIYVYETNSQIVSFKHAQTKNEQKIKESLDERNNQILAIYWQRLIDHFQLDQSKYIAIPLTKLVKFNDEKLLSLSERETYRVIGQLWEGLYKNYIIDVLNEKTHDIPHYMPLILIAKDLTHLHVIYELNGEKKLLKQKI